MKKWIVCILSVVMIFALAACGGKSEDSADADQAEKKAETATAVQRDLPEGDYEEVGSGTFYLSGASGSTENGDEIIIYPDMNALPYAHLDIELWDMDGSILTYVYIDGVKVKEKQVGAGLQSSMSLQEEWQVTEGDHIVEAVQYADNDTSGEMVFYRSAKYTVKSE